MFSRFFIDRPIFAAVISVFFVLAGLAAMRSLPIAQYPEIAPPVVTVTAVYPGASAEALEQTVAAPLENAINGVQRMLYMESHSTRGRDPDHGHLRDRHQRRRRGDQRQQPRQAGRARLPLEVRRQGVAVERGSSSFLQVFAFYSPDGRYDGLSPPTT